MAIYMRIKNLELDFMTLSKPPLIANDLNVDSEAGRKQISSYLTTHYTGEALSSVPSCDCKKLTGGEYKYEICEVCHSPCVVDVDKPIESLLWLRVPDQVDAFINPMVWTIMSNTMTEGYFNILEWLVNPYYKPSAKTPQRVKRMEQMGVLRGLNNFHRNFDHVMQCYFDANPARKVDNRQFLLGQFIKKYRECIFTKYVPMPSKIGFVLETNDTGTYADTTMNDALDALYTITSIESSVFPLSVAKRQIRAVKAISGLATYYHNFIRDVISGKYGLARKHLFGGRLHFTARAVITSISGQHMYDELHIPWGVGVRLFREHITSKLHKRGYSPVEINDIIDLHTATYSKLLDDIFNELIAESPWGGIPCLFQRNPSLKRGSMQRLRITKVKTDPDINTISMSVLVLKAPNADYDGDEMNLLLILDHKMYAALEPLAPHYGALDLQTPYTFSDNLLIPAPVIATIANWLHELI